MLLKEFELPIGQNVVLNPKIWEHNRLKGEVKTALLRIAEDFLDYVDVPVKVVDVVIAGGNANYTYTNKSDLDLHIIADVEATKCDREAMELFDAKRLLYKKEHDISVKSIPVELYIEDHRTPAVSAAYSLLKDRWIREPQQARQEWDKESVNKMVEVWKTLFAAAIKTGDLQTCRSVLKLLREYRKKGLKTAEGEYSVANLVYKSLRNDQTLEGLVTLVNKLHDRELSLKEQ
jgi:hypothetical protein